MINPYEPPEAESCVLVYCPRATYYIKCDVMSFVFWILLSMLFGALAGSLADDAWRGLCAKGEMLKQLESGAIGDGIRERIERRREERPEPKPVHIEELDGDHPAEKKPRPILQGISRAFKAAMGWAELPTKIVLGYYLTLGTVVFAFTCGVIKTIVYMRGRKAKR